MTTPAQHLQALGLTEWESRAYLALVEEAPLSGYAVAKRSGIPRGKIYEVLASLVNKNTVHVARSDPQLYGPLPPKELIERYRRQMTERLAAAENAMESYASQLDGDAVIWDIQGRREIIERVRDLVRRARRRILLEIWAADASELRKDLQQAASRGLQVIAVAYGDPDYPFAEVHQHPSTDEVTTGLGGRWLVVSADDREIVAGNVSSGSQSRAAWTRHPGLAVPVTELIVHDLYKLEILATHGELLESTFGPGLIRLRERFNSSKQDA